MKWMDWTLPLLDRSLRSILSGEVPEESKVEEVEADPQIPDGYFDRFSLKPLEDPGMMLGREAERELVTKAYKSWTIDGLPLLLVSEPGVGMTTFLNACATALPKVQRLEENHRLLDQANLRSSLSQLLGVEEDDDLQRMVDQLDDEPRTLIFENVERLFLRAPGGFDRLRDLLSLMALSRRKIFWILTVSRYSTYFLDRVIEFSTNFRSRILLGALPPETLEAAVMARNEGFELVFLKPENLSSRLARQYRRAPDNQAKQELLRQNFLRSFHAYTQGNISRGLLYFRKSVRGVRDQRVYLKAYARDLPKDLGHDNLLALEAILLHASLSVPDLATVLRRTEYYALQRVTNLLESGLVVPQETSRKAIEYQINLDVLYEVKNAIRDKLNRQSY